MFTGQNEVLRYLLVVMLDERVCYAAFSVRLVESGEKRGREGKLGWLDG